MSFQFAAGNAATPFAMPNCPLPIRPGFIDALQCAAEFTSRGTQYFPWTKNVYLVDGKLYASDNRCIVEIDLKDDSLGPVQFSPETSTFFKGWRKSQPSDVHATCGGFPWDNSRWASFDAGDMAGFELVDRARALLDEYWHDGRKVPAEVRAAVTGLKSGKGQTKLVLSTSSAALSQSNGLGTGKLLPR